MSHQKQEYLKNNEEIFQSQSSKISRVLTENNNISKSRIPSHKYSLDQNSFIKIDYNNDINDEKNNKIKLEEHKDNSNKTKNNFNKGYFLNHNNKNQDERNFYISESHKTYLKEMGIENNDTEENNYNSDVVIENNIENKNPNKNKYDFKESISRYNNIISYKEEKKIPHLNFSYDYFPNMNDINNSKKENILSINNQDNNNFKINNKERNVGKDINVDANTDNNNNEIFNRNEKYNKNYKEDILSNEKYIEANTNINNYINKKDNEYSNLSNQKIIFFKKEPIKNKENFEIEKKEEKLINTDHKSQINEEKKLIRVNKSYKNEKIKNKQNRKENIFNKKKNINKPHYYFCYDNNIIMRNYYPRKSAKTEYSTEQNTINHNYQENQKIEVKEFREIETDDYNSNNELGEKEIEDNINEEIDSEKYNKLNNNKKSDIINIYHMMKMENNEDIDINNYNNLKKLKYINDINNINIYGNDEKIKHDKKYIENIIEDENNVEIINENEKEIKKNNHQFNYDSQNFKKINNNNESLIINNDSKYINDKISLQNENMKEDLDININFEKYKENDISNTNDSINVDTLETFSIKKMDEEEEIRTLEIEKEAKRLSELEEEKNKLMMEEKERRKKILLEIEKQEIWEYERKIKMRKRFETSLKKKKEDEERLKQIKKEQEKKMKEINELIYHKKLDEEKLSLLEERKLNRHQRKIYRNMIKNESFKNQKTIPFFYIKDKNKEIFKKMKNYYINKDFKYWNINENKINSIENNEDYKNGLGPNIIKNKKIDNENSGIKLHKNFNYLEDSHTINSDKINNMKDKINFNINTKYNDIMSFSQDSYNKKNVSLSPKKNNNKLNTEIIHKFYFSPQNNGQNINKIANIKNNNIEIYNEELKNNREDIKNEFYKKIIKNLKQ